MATHLKIWNIAASISNGCWINTILIRKNIFLSSTQHPDAHFFLSSLCMCTFNAFHISLQRFNIEFIVVFASIYINKKIKRNLCSSLFMTFQLYKVYIPFGCSWHWYEKKNRVKESAWRILRYSKMFVEGLSINSNTISSSSSSLLP